MLDETQVEQCPKCGNQNAKKVNYTWWGGLLAPRLFSLVKCNVCGTEYNGKTGQSSRRTMIIYQVVAFATAFCICGGFGVLAVIINNQH
jgi:hypothetical protein